MADAPGLAFRAADVAERYVHRPPYAEQVYETILEAAPGLTRLLDLGCGEGKIARPMARHFGQVVAVDPSAAMIERGQGLENGTAPNIAWITSTAEDAALQGLFDVVTFASSIHWMEPKVLFPKLRRHLQPDHLLAFVSGDEAWEPPWANDWQDFLKVWVPRMTGRALNSADWRGSRTRHLDHVDVLSTHAFVSSPVRQTVDGFILCQQSRDTFALRKLGAERAGFERELSSLLTPHADGDGMLTYQVKSHLTLAKLPRKDGP